MSTRTVAQIEGVERHNITIEYLLIPFDGTFDDLHRLQKLVPEGFHVSGYQYIPQRKAIFCRNRPKEVVEIDAP